MGDSLPPGPVVTLGDQAAPALATPEAQGGARCVKGLQLGPRHLLKEECGFSEGEEGIEATFLPCRIARAPSCQPNDCGVTLSWSGEERTCIRLVFPLCGPQQEVVSGQ